LPPLNPAKGPKMNLLKARSFQIFCMT
jgi:hypothetical protein